MLRTIMMTGTAICLSMGSGLARADHDDGLRYVIGGAIIGAALGELAYSTGHRGHVVVDYGFDPYGYSPYGYSPYAYAPYRLYPPRFRGHMRGFGPGYRGHGFRHRHGFGHDRRHHRHWRR